jgi:hypothetical protein
MLRDKNVCDRVKFAALQIEDGIRVVELTLM